MHIGILAPITHRIPPNSYGPWELIASQLAEGLVSRGIKVTLFATVDAKTSAHLHAVVPGALAEHTSWPARAWEQIHIGETLSAVHALKIDLLHNHLNFWPLPFASLLSVPMLTTLHGAAMLEDDSRMVFERYRHLPYVSISHAERTAVPTLNYVANVYNGIDLSLFPFFPQGGESLLFLGRVSAAKGTDHAIELARRSGRRLIIAGPVPASEKDFFEQKIRPHLDGQRIIYVGTVDAQGREHLFRETYALLHLVRQPEPFGLVLIEAMATGTPVIGLDRGAVREVVGPGQGGFVVQNLEEAERALTNIDQLNRQRIRERVANHFTVDRMVDGYIQAYRTVLSTAKQ
ncbi:glycosyltransferase family 4 protein [Thermicanus aegyptius]|uniref:glycosyltransferase family 4 protein n=1 Tax=Thermicanus aegyptius TaxID=94009 RepID=UPI0003F7E783|nr:glycosyltransferase family 4 protein [Thermicanus aegyptius]